MDKAMHSEFEGHTPEPWTYGLQLLSDGVGDDGNYINQRSVTDYYSIKAGEGFWREEDNTRGFCLTGYMSESNARLLAAAPDLLKENQSLRSELQKQKELNAELVEGLGLAKRYVSEGADMLGDATEVQHIKIEFQNAIKEFESLIKKSKES